MSTDLVRHVECYLERHVYDRCFSALMQSSHILVLGAGYAGLAAAALLAQRGYQVVVLEAHDTFGGCAGFYRRGAITFDVGATTFSGIQPWQPVGQVFAELCIQPEFEHQNPGMIVRIDGDTIVRHSNPETWINSMVGHFGPKQREFWHNLYQIEERVWRLIANKPYLPPSSAADWLAMATPSNLSALSLLPGMVRSMQQLMVRHGVHDNPVFQRFINEQLLISTQSTADHAPWLTGALGLTYPSETYYPIGGMYRPALQLVRTITANGGSVLYRRVVTSIEEDKGALVVRCANGQVYRARHVVSSIPIWNLATIATGRLGLWATQQAKRYQTAWCAITAYAAFEGYHTLPTAYVQSHLRRPIPGVHSGSIFVTVKPNHDHVKAPDGVISVTLSTHARWGDVPTADVLAGHLQRALFNAVPELTGMPMTHFEVGTPATWQRYTLRHNGFVGGLPHSTRRPLIMMPHNRTPVRGFWMIGDTAFPGQGMPSVFLGARNTVQRILAAEGHSS